MNSMQLDNLAYIQSLDSSHLLLAINDLPDQIRVAWEGSAALNLPWDPGRVRQVVLAAMGPAGTAAEIAASRVAGECRVPLLVWRDFEAPGFVGPDTLVLAISPDGDDEETLSAALAAGQRGAMVAAMTREGEMASAAASRNWPVADLCGGAPVIMAAGPLAVGVLGVLARLSLGRIDADEVTGASAAVRQQQNHLRAEVPVTANPAKRMAGQLMDRLTFIFAAEPLAPIARHWQSQISLMAKSPAMSAAVPEMDHNAIAGTLSPEALISKHMVLVLRSTFGHPRAQALADQTRLVYMTAGFNTDAVDGVGSTPLAHMLTTLNYGDYAAFYLAMCYGADPKI